MASRTRPRRRDKRHPAEREAALLEAAERLLAERGVTATTVADIAAAAGLAKGTFYLHFETKEQLLAALKSRFVSDMLAGAAAYGARVGQQDWWELVDDFVAAMIDGLLVHLPLIEVMTQETPTPATRELFGDAEGQIVDLLAAGVEAGIAAGVFDVRNPRLLALLLIHAVMCSIEHLVIYSDPVDRDELVLTTQELVRKALARRAGS